MKNHGHFFVAVCVLLGLACSGSEFTLLVTVTPPAGAPAVATGEARATSTRAPRPPTRAPDLAPDFTLPLLEDYRGDLGEEVRLSDLQGEKVVVLHFWASWCGPCKAEFPLIQETWERYKDRGVLVLGVDYADDEQEALEFLRDAGATFPNGQDQPATISDEYRVIGVPSTFFIDRDGKLAHRQVGPLQEDRIDELLEPLLES